MRECYSICRSKCESSKKHFKHRFLHRLNLRGNEVPDGHVPGALRHPQNSRLGCPVGGDAPRPGTEDRASQTDLSWSTAARLLPNSQSTESGAKRGLMKRCGTRRPTCLGLAVPWRGRYSLQRILSDCFYVQ